MKLRPLLFATLVATFSCGDSGTAPSGGRLARIELTLARVRTTYPLGDTVRARAVPMTAKGEVVHTSRTWRSLNPSIAVVDANGLITMRAHGSTTIEVEAGGLVARVPIEVQGILHTRMLESETWRAAASPHVVQGLIHVDHTDTMVLTIEPGATVLFRPGSGIEFGSTWGGRLVMPGGGPGVIMAGDSLGHGTWIGLFFQGSLESELRNVIFRHCGAGAPGGQFRPCVEARSASPGIGTRLLVQDVSFEGPRGWALSMGVWSEFAPGSRNLRVSGSDGHVATIAANVIRTWPTGGQLQGNAHQEIFIEGGIVDQSTFLPELGVAWRLTQEVFVSGQDAPMLTIPPGALIRADINAGIEVSSWNGAGSLVAGSEAGAPVVFEAVGAEGWGGITFRESGGPNRLSNVVMRECGAQAFRPCLDHHGGTFPPPTLVLQSVTIENSRSDGLRLSGIAQFDPASRDLTIRGSQGAALILPSGAASGIPLGDYGFNGTEGVVLWGDHVPGPTTWRDIGVPYRATNGLTVGGALTLEPGVEIRMAPGSWVGVAAGPAILRAVGTAAKPIVFGPMVEGPEGMWVGLDFGEEITAESKLEHVRIRNAGIGDPGGAVRLRIDLGGLVRSTTIVGSPSCGIVHYGEGPWVDDYAAVEHSNQFLENAGPPLCRLIPY